MISECKPQFRMSLLISVLLTGGALATADPDVRSIDGAKHPAWRPDSGALAVKLIVGNEGRIGTVDLDGVVLWTVEPETPIESYPAWGADGASIVFHAGAPGGFGLVEYEITSESRRLILPPEVDIEPSLSPDGERIAFSSWRGGQHNIYVCDRSGANLSEITTGDGGNTYPAWSPDGEWIAFHSARSGAHQIYKVRSDGADLQQVTAGDFENRCPSWSPDGRSIVFFSTRDGDREIYTMDADGGSPRRLTSNPARDEYPKWSPDGEWIAFHSDRNGAPSVFLIRPNGHDLREITIHPPGG